MRVEDLEAELERVRAVLAEAEESLRRRVIALEALAEEDAPAVPVVSQRKPVGPRRAVTHRDDAAGAEVLSVDYRALMAAALEAGADGLGARRVRSSQFTAATPGEHGGNELARHARRHRAVNPHGQLVPQQATFAPSRRPARTLAAPAESPSTSSTRT
ncbi:hypothetical protein ABT215_25155, partial [Streptomyces sp900105755]